MAKVTFKDLEQAREFKNGLDKEKISYTLYQTNFKDGKRKWDFYTEGYNKELEVKLEAKARGLK